MKHAHFLIKCQQCNQATSKAYAYKHEGLCKACTTPNTPHSRKASRIASREVQHARYLDCGPSNWDDR